MNRRPFLIALLLAAFSFTGDSRADEPATEFFAIETAKLEKLAAADADLDKLNSVQLEKMSIAHGWYGGGLAVTFSTEAFRLDARFTGSAPAREDGQDSIGYLITAGKGQEDWNVLSTEGKAVRQGRIFITKDWRKQKVVVILRVVNLKH